MTNWIPLSGPGSRMPTKEDASFRREVVWLWEDGSATIARWDEAWDDPQLIGWFSFPPYTPPGPTDEECIRLSKELGHGTPFAHINFRRWFADVTARIEREKL